MQLLTTRSNSATANRDALVDLFEQKGHWVIYRRYDLTSSSEYKTLGTGEGVGGARWTYSDKPIKVRQDRASVRASAGTMTDVSKVYVDWRTSPRRGDVIIEINYDGDNRLLTPGFVMQIDHRQAYTIEDYAPYRGENGIIVYYTCIVKPQFEDY